MYLGTDFHRFWARCGNLEQHPDDVPFLKNNPFIKGVLPCPFDGPLEKAKVVICLANPSYSKDIDKKSLNALLLSMRTGEESLPDLFANYYKRITGPIGEYSTQLQNLVAVFNVCPYASNTMENKEVKIAAGLPSVWQAQQYLRQTLIPRAQTGNIHLVLIRKLQLWGITEPENVIGNMHVIYGRERNGVMSRGLGEEIRKWLVRKGHLTN